MRRAQHVQQPRMNTGEPFVWATAMGLAVGLVMIVYLLGLIVVSGYDAFWPKRVVLVELSADSQARLNEAPALAGEIVKQQQKVTRTLSKQSPDDGASHTEWQLFIGNKDAYGIGFRYVDYADIARVSYPADLIVIERLEYGNAIGVPLALDMHGQGRLAATDEQFAARLQTGSSSETNQRWRAIRRIEKYAIGAINARMDTLRLQQRALDRVAQVTAQAAEHQAQSIQQAMADSAGAIRSVGAGGADVTGPSGRTRPAVPSADRRGTPTAIGPDSALLFPQSAYPAGASRTPGP